MRPVVLILFVAALAACTPEETRSEQKVEAAVAEQLASRGEAFWKQCRKEAVERASDTVDSLLLARAHEAYLLESNVPPRPERPELDSLAPEQDSIPLTPILPGKSR